MLTLPPTAASWKTPLQDVMSQSSWATLCERVEDAYNNAVCFPPKHELFKAFELCSPQQIKVVILGQDPYHGAGQANGLAFSVHTGVKAPPSLRNLLKEAFNDVGAMPWVDLSRWAEQGVFLLNTSLSVEEKKPGSHSSFGWEPFTDEVIRIISEQQPHVVFMLWGNHAQKKERLIDASKHLVLKAPHPSPLSAYQGFFGCKHFSKANAYLELKGLTRVAW
jgi:uracil-DNA glycosylase